MSYFSIISNNDLGIWYRTIYWTKPSRIMQAWADGTNEVEIVSGFDPRGIAVDYKSSKLYWADWWDGVVQSSGLDGSNVQTLVSEPYVSAIAVDENRVYYGNWHWEVPPVMRSCNKTGGDVKTLYTGDSTTKYTLMSHLALMSPHAPETGRRNECEDQICDGICVLTPSSYRCLSF